MSVMAVFQVSLVAALISVGVAYVVMWLERSKNSGFVESVARGSNHAMGEELGPQSVGNSFSLSEMAGEGTPSRWRGNQLSASNSRTPTGPQIRVEHHGLPETMTKDLIALANCLGGGKSEDRERTAVRIEESAEQEREEEMNGSLVPVRVRGKAVPFTPPHGPQAA